MDWDYKSLLATNSFQVKRCSFRLLLLPIVTLGLVGFVVNYTNLSFLYINHGSCTPKQNIVFLKTHKCAGSSIQNILMRYGDTRNLTFVLPDSANYLGHPAVFNKNFVAKPLLRNYNILTHHTRFDYNGIQRLMPSDTVFITIVRDPVQLFESSYNYYELETFYRMDFRKFAKLSLTPTARLNSFRYNKKFGLNQMMFDLGATPTVISNETLSRLYVDLIDTWFDFVLIAERMDESLILLKELLCWTIDDVITFKLNARNPVYKTNLTESLKSNLRRLNAADQMLYDHFVSKFDSQVEQFGRDRVSEEVALLREKTQLWYDFCVRDVQPLTLPKGKTKYHLNPRVMTFEGRPENNNATCKAMIMEELAYTDYLLQKQHKPTKKPKNLARTPRIYKLSKLRH